MKSKKPFIALFCGASSLLVSHIASAQERLPPQYYPKSVRGAVLAYSDIHGRPLAATASLPADGSLCKPPPPDAPSPATLPPFSVVKVLDQRSFFWTVPKVYFEGPVDSCLWAWANTLPHIDTWYRIVAIDETGAPKRTTDGQVIEGWTDAEEFEAAADPFATVKAAKQREGERWCPPGAHKVTAYEGIVWDVNSPHRLPWLGRNRPVEILGPVWRPWIFNQACSMRLEDTGEIVTMDATSVISP